MDTPSGRFVLRVTPELHRRLRDRAAATAIAKLCDASRRLRRDRELAFHGSEDLTPSAFDREADAREARRQARRVVEVVTTSVGR
jgi:hypothetical protein